MMRALSTLAVALCVPAGAVSQDSLITRVPRDWHSVTHVRDVLPHLERLLASKKLHETWRAAVPELAKLQPALRGVAPKTLGGVLGLVRQRIPSEIVIAWPDVTNRSAGALMEAGVRVALGWIVCEQNGIDAPELASFRGDAARVLDGIGSPRGLIAVRMRDERTAEAAFDDLGDAAAEAFEECLLEDESIRCRMTLDDAFERGAAWARLDALAALPAGDGYTKAIRAALDKVDIELHVVLEGAEIVCRIGSMFEQEMRKDGEPLFDAGQLDGEMIVDVAWSIESFVEHATSAYELLLELDDDAYEAMYDTDASSAAVDELIDWLVGISEMPAEAGYRVHVVESGLDVGAREVLYDWVPPTLADSPVWSAIPDDVPFAAVTSFWTFDELAHLIYDGIITDLDSAKLEAYSRGMEKLGDWADAASSTLMWQFEGVWDLLAGEDSAVFTEGTLVVADGTRAPHAAIAGLPDSEGAARAFFEDLVDNVGIGLELDAPRRGWVAEADLGQGLTAWTTRLPGLPEIDDPRVASRCFPHAAYVDGLFILSTSPELTRSIVATHGRDGVARAPRDLVGRVRTSGAGLAEIVRRLAERLGGDRASDTVSSVLGATAAFCDAVDTVSADETLDGDALQTHFRIRFRD